MIQRLFILLLLAAFSAPAAFASDLFTYQGKLTDAAGAALTDGQYRIGVRIWDVASSGTEPLWARKYDVPVKGGVFSLMIGATGIAWNDPAPLTASLKLAVSGTSRFLEITVMSEADGPEKPAGQWQVLAPRQALGAVPYAMNGVPPGTVVPFAGTVVPDGWMLCDGVALSLNDPRYASLFATLGTTYGNNGANTFRVPDLRGRTAIGAGQGAELTARTLGQSVGAEKHILTIAEMPAHDHGGITSTDGEHTHAIEKGNGSAEGSVIQWGDGNGSHPTFIDSAGEGGSGRLRARASGNHNHTISSQGGNQSHNNMQPSLALNYIIKL